ncbi:MAG: YgaP family membrane protein [Pseudomonadota bacterium]
MTVNMGSADRIIRAVVGIVLIALVFVGPQTVWGWIGVIPLATAAIGICPAYSLLGIKTCKKQ